MTKKKPSLIVFQTKPQGSAKAYVKSLSSLVAGASPLSDFIAMGRGHPFGSVGVLSNDGVHSLCKGSPGQCLD